MENKIIEVKLRLKPGTPEDFKIDVSALRYGQPFWLISNLTKKLEGPYFVNGNTNVHDLKGWLNLKMIFVPLTNTIN